MTIHEQCLPCLVQQAVRTAEMTSAKDRESLYHRIFEGMSRLDFGKTNPEIVGETFRIIKEHLGLEDPYRETKAHYNRRFQEYLRHGRQHIGTMEEAVMYAAAANIIDFNPAHLRLEEEIDRCLKDVSESRFAVLDLLPLRRDLTRARELLVLGDNCGEICFDKLMIRRIRERYPHLQVTYGVRGAPVVNDVTLEDAAMVRMEETALVISNGDDSLGTVLSRVSPAFLECYRRADVVIAKGQGNLESLFEENKCIYFLCTVKCGVIAHLTGTGVGQLICMRNPRSGPQD